MVGAALAQSAHTGETSPACLCRQGAYRLPTHSDRHRLCGAQRTQESTQKFATGTGNAMPEVTALQQVARSQLQGHQLQHNDAQHLLIIDGSVVPCTPSEYDLLMPRLRHAGEPVSFTLLLGSDCQKCPLL